MDECRATESENLALKHFSIGVLIAITLLAILLTPLIWQACFHNVRTSQLDLITPGMAKQEVIRLIGKPRRDYGDRCWIYDRDFFGDVLIYFNENGTVEMLTI